MRKIPKTGPRRYKPAYNVGYRAGIKKATNGSGLTHQPVRTVIQGNTFEISPESSTALDKRSDAVKELAIALGKIADALKGATNTGLTIAPKETT